MARGDWDPDQNPSSRLAKEQRPLVSPGWTARGILDRAEGLAISLFLFPALIVINGIQMASLVFLPVSRPLVRRINRWCANTWWSWCVIASERWQHVEPVFTGDFIPEKENAILVANHQQMPDIVALMMLGYRKQRLGDLKWFVKDVLKYVPGVGWGMLFLDCLFLKRNWDSDQAKIEATFAKFKQHQIPIWLISFSEGTRITQKKLDKSREFAHRQGWHVPTHTLVPRTKGFVASVQGLRNHLDAVYDVTIGYETGLPTVWQLLCGWVPRIHLDVRRFPIAQLPYEPESLAAWLRLRFEAKDEAMARFIERGTF